ncbi:MAG TPA: P1 family peptidase [Candidatus Limnocylindria bacterium]|jgi:D-aminopeptidase
MRARDVGIQLGALPPGRLNAITDVEGVRVGHTTLIRGDKVRTGVTVVVPHGDDPGANPVFAGAHTLNGNGEMTGLEWIREAGTLISPIGLTNTHSVGIVHHALVGAGVRQAPDAAHPRWSLPVVAETWDGYLNDIDGRHVTEDDALAALAAAAAGPVEEGNVGGGTGMKAFGFKAGIGTASRVVPEEHGGFTVGAVVQANFGRRERLMIDGVLVGREIPQTDIPGPDPAPRVGSSIIVVLATDAPLLPHQCRRLAQRATIGVARTGGGGEHDSGDIFLAFATGNRNLRAEDHADAITRDLVMLDDDHITALFWAAIEATEEAIVNSLLAARTMTGNGVTFHALPVDRLLEVMRRYGRGPV